MYVEARAYIAFVYRLFMYIRCLSSQAIEWSDTVAYAGILKGPGHYAEGRILIDGGAINTYIPTRF